MELLPTTLNYFLHIVSAIAVKRKSFNSIHEKSKTLDGIDEQNWN